LLNLPAAHHDDEGCYQAANNGQKAN